MPAKKKENDTDKEQQQENAAPPAQEVKADKRAPQLERIIWRVKKPPPRAITIGMLEIKELPDETTQRAGFPHEHARELALNIRDYKLDLLLGER